jgi:hypothetical protein
MVVMASDEDRQRNQDEGCDQAAPPPAILSEHIVLNTMDTFLKTILLFFPLTSSAACFFRHELLPPLLIWIDPAVFLVCFAHSTPSTEMPTFDPPQSASDAEGRL